MQIRFIAASGCVILCAAAPFLAYAQTTTDARAVATDTPAAAFVGTIIDNVSEAPAVDLTKPESDPAKEEIRALFAERTLGSLNPVNAFAYWVRYAIDLGIPANTIVLILLVPIIATLVAFTRTILGLPALDMFVPSALAYAFVAVGIVPGVIIIASVLLASYISRLLLAEAPLMIFPKRSLSHLILALSVLGALTLALATGFTSVKDLSIFPIIILVLLGDAVVAVQLRKSLRETAIVVSVTIVLGLVGYWLATSLAMRDALLLWPEALLLTIPINIALGRYFGLRVAEVLRFRTLDTYGSE